MIRQVWRLARENAVALAILVILVGGFLFLKQGSSVGSLTELDTALRDGRPTVLEFFSNT
jgi:hypothetical protein